MSNLRVLGFQEKLAYVARKSKAIERIVLVKCEKMIEFELLLSKFGFKTSHSLIYSLKTLEDAHSDAYMNYRPAPYKGPVAIFFASRQPLGISPDPTLGWGNLIEGELEIHPIPGHYLTFLVEPTVRVLGERMRASLEKAQIGTK